MQVFVVSLQKVIDSGRDDFDFHNPAVESARGFFRHDADIATLGDVCEGIRNGRTPAKSAYVTEGIRILKVKNLSGVGIRWDETAFVSRSFYAHTQKGHVQDGDILMLCSAHNKVYIGRCDVVTGLEAEVPSGECCAVGEVIIIRARRELILPEYLVTYLRLPMVQADISKMVKGQSAHLYPKDLQQLQIVVPALHVQYEIAQVAMAAEVDYRGRIAEANRLLSEARGQVDSMIRKAAESAPAFARSASRDGAGSMPLFDGLVDDPADLVEMAETD